MNASQIRRPVRLMIYLAGIVCISLGIVLCKKTNMGISPISSIPYVLEKAVQLSFGILTMLYHFANTILQIILLRKITAKLLAQFALGALFGQIINLFQLLLRFEAGSIAAQLVCLALSVFFTAFGMVLMINMQLIQNPPDGLVHLIADLTGRKTGSVKTLYDLCCIGISLIISLLMLGQIQGFGLSTIVSALCVGRLVNILTPVFLPLLKRLQE